MNEKSGILVVRGLVTNLKKEQNPTGGAVCPPPLTPMIVIKPLDWPYKMDEYLYQPVPFNYTSDEKIICVRFIS